MAPAPLNSTVKNCVDYLKQLGFDDVVSLCDQNGVRRGRQTLVEECAEYVLNHHTPEHLSICSPEESFQTSGTNLIEDLDVSCPYGWGGCCDTAAMKDWATFASLYVLIGFTLIWLAIRSAFYILLHRTELTCHSNDELVARLKEDVKAYLASYNNSPLFSVTYVVAMIVNIKLATTDPKEVTIKEVLIAWAFLILLCLSFLFSTLAYCIHMDDEAESTECSIVNENSDEDDDNVELSEVNEGAVCNRAVYDAVLDEKRKSEKNFAKEKTETTALVRH